MKFNFKKNETTGNLEAQFQVKLVSELSKETLQNSNGKNYKIATVEFENVKGVIQKSSAAIYEANYIKGVEKDNTYLAVVTIVDGKAYIQMSHLQNAGRASIVDFGFIHEPTVAKGVLAE